MRLTGYADIMPSRQNVDTQNVDRHNVEQTKFRQKKYRTDKMYVTPCMQNTEETIAKYDVDANLLRLGSTKHKKNIQALDAFLWGAKPPTKKNVLIFLKKKNSSKVFKFT